MLHARNCDYFFVYMSVCIAVSVTFYVLDHTVPFRPYRDIIKHALNLLSCRCNVAASASDKRMHYK